MIFNPLNNPENEGLKDLSRRELAVLLPLLIGIVWLGLYPGPVLRRMEPATQRYVDVVQPHAGASTAARLGAAAPAREGRP
jgi:NADH-quinone oxidoreductase subunit M